MASKVMSGICRWVVFLFFELTTAYEMRIRYWSSDVCSSERTDAPAAGAEEKTLLMQESHKKDAIQRIQIGLTGLAGVVLLVGLANIVVEKAGVSDGGTVTAIDDAPPRPLGRAWCRESVCQYA